MRRYGDSYANSIDSTLAAAANSVDTTSYSRVISNTRVNSNRRTVRSDCLCAANSAYHRMDLIRDKLEHLRPVLSTFYSEVEDTGSAIYNIINPMCTVLSNINSSLTSLSRILGETGSYSGTTATPAAINAACAPVQEASATMVNYYETTFTNPDGTLNQEAVTTYFEEYDELIAEGTVDEPCNAYQTYGLIQATEDYLAANDYSDEAYSEATSILMTGMLVQNNEVPPPHDDIQYYSMDPEETRLAYMTYEVRDSGRYFVHCYENVLQSNYIAGGYGLDVNHVGEDHPQFVDSLQMSNILAGLTSNEYISVPVEMDNFYMYEHRANTEPFGYDQNRNASLMVELPFRANFQVTTVDPETITDATGSTYTPDSVVRITYSCETSQGTVNDFYLYDATENGGSYTLNNPSHITTRYIVTGDNSTGNLCDSASYEVSESYMQSHVTELTAWDYIRVIFPVDIPEAVLKMPGAVGYAGDLAEGLYDLAEARDENQRVAYLTQQLDSNEAIGNLYENTGAYGSYYLDVVVEEDGSSNLDVGTLHTTAPMIDPWVAQTHLGYQQASSGSDICLVYDLANEHVVDDLCGPSGSSESYYQWRVEMEQYYADTHDGHSVTELTPQQYIEYMEYFNNNIYVHPS